MMKIRIVGLGVNLIATAQKALEKLFGNDNEVLTEHDVIVDDSGTDLPISHPGYSKLFDEDTTSQYSYNLIPCYSGDYNYPKFEDNSYPTPRSHPKPKKTFHHIHARLSSLKRQIECDGDSI